jgi:hypothetical protein
MHGMNIFTIISASIPEALTNSLLGQKPVMEETTAEGKVTYSTISYRPNTLCDKSSLHHLCP